MSEMVERVREMLSHWSLNGCEDAHELARDILEALREPTEAMLAAGLDGYRFGAQNDDEGYAVAADQCWQAMIDAALTPSPQPHDPEPHQQR
jgi:hypothetical protein